MSERTYLEALEEGDFLERLVHLGPQVYGLLSQERPLSSGQLAALREWIADRNRRRKEAEAAKAERTI
jgi:hypothetical protein